MLVERVGEVRLPIRSSRVLVGEKTPLEADLRRGAADHFQDWPHLAPYLRCGRPAPTPLGTRISNSVPTSPPRTRISVPSAPRRVRTGRLGPPYNGPLVR